MSRTIIIGDIHGCSKELNLLLEKVKVDKNKDILISLGDVVDKGPDPIGAIRLLMDNNAVLVRGNHEDPYIRYYQKGLTAAEVNAKDIKEYRKAEYAKLVGTPEFAWVAKNATIYTEIVVNGQLFTFTHAGVVPYIDLYNMKKRHIGEALRVRYLDAETHGFIRMVPVDHDKYPDEVASWKPEHDNVVEWQKVYKKEKYGIVVHGHIIVGPNPVFWIETPEDTRRVEMDAQNISKNAPIKLQNMTEAGLKVISLDTGAHKGWNLTAMVIDEDSGNAYFEQVEAAICYEP